MSEVLELACELIRRPSVTPDDGGCQDLLAERLGAAGFDARQLDFGPVRNLWALHGKGRPLLVFLGHTDVVPPGPEDRWTSPPFRPTVDGDLLRGRGAADMKGAVAAMAIALERFATAAPDHQGTVALLVTSDEEGIAEDGIKRVVPALSGEGIVIDFCLVGEPSSGQALGDTIRIGRRGALNGWLTVRGVQGHSAFPELARNPIHEAAPALAALAEERWDSGDEHFPPTTLAITNLNAGVGAVNVIPGELTATFNFRFGPASSADSIKRRVVEVLRAHRLEFELDWQLSGEPFLTEEGELSRAVKGAIQRHTGRAPVANTGGGTSDGRFVAPTGAQVVELGLINATIHQVDESTVTADLDTLAAIYQSVIEELLS